MNSTSLPVFRNYSSRREFDFAAARLIAERIKEVTQTKSRGQARGQRRGLKPGLEQGLEAQNSVCRMVLAGGSTPAGVYQKLVELNHESALNWKNVELFIGDERLVSPADPSSNYAMIKQNLLTGLEASNQQILKIHSWNTELSPSEAVVEYQQQLKIAKISPAAGFDIVLAGVGPDGHTASIFPADQQTQSTKDWVAATLAPNMFAIKNRLTLTLTALNCSDYIYVLAGRQGKQRILDLWKTNPAKAAEIFPAARLHGRQQTLVLTYDS